MKHRLARWLWVHDVGFNIGLALVAIALLAQIVASWLPR